MPSVFRLAARMFFEKPGRRDSGSARTSISCSTPALFRAKMNSAIVVASYPIVNTLVMPPRA
jgi:hypothetical protein